MWSESWKKYATASKYTWLEYVKGPPEVSLEKKKYVISVCL